MKQYGLIGEKLGHSYSKTLHSFLGDYRYDLWAMPPEALDSFMRARAFDGMNVTIPYKQAVIPYLDEIGKTARRIGAVNTIVKRADGLLFGDNTDAYGFAEMARRAGIDFRDEKTLVLGSGGTSLTVCDTVSEAGGVAVVISRSGENDYDHIQKHTDAAFLVNTTPVGMYPNTNLAAIDLTRLPKLRGVLDVIYNPLRTRLLQQAKALHIPCEGGLSMLVTQAMRACEMFTGEAVLPERAKRAEAALRKAAMNLVIVGMPGCGKSTIGEILAQSLQLPLVDIDEIITREAGMPISAIFEAEGESGFRMRETAQIAKYGKEGGCILVTGGGAVKDSVNREYLCQNGFVVYITRKLDKLAMDKRPLSKDMDTLRRLWQEREPLYIACADMRIANEKTPAACAQAIVEGYHEALCAQRS